MYLLISALEDCTKVLRVWNFISVISYSFSYSIGFQIFLKIILKNLYGMQNFSCLVSVFFYLKNHLIFLLSHLTKFGAFGL